MIDIASLIANAKPDYTTMSYRELERRARTEQAAVDELARRRAERTNVTELWNNNPCYRFCEKQKSIAIANIRHPENLTPEQREWLETVYLPMREELHQEYEAYLQQMAEEKADKTRYNFRPKRARKRGQHTAHWREAGCF